MPDDAAWPTSISILLAFYLSYSRTRSAQCLHNGSLCQERARRGYQLTTLVSMGGRCGEAFSLLVTPIVVALVERNVLVPQALKAGKSFCERIIYVRNKAIPRCLGAALTGLETFLPPNLSVGVLLTLSTTSHPISFWPLLLFGHKWPRLHCHLKQPEIGGLGDCLSMESWSGDGIHHKERISKPNSDDS